MYPFERFSDDAKRVLTLAQKEAERAHHSYIGTEHLLLGLLQSGTEASRILVTLGVDDGRARDQIEGVLGRNERIIIQQIVPTSRVRKVIELAFEAARREDSQAVTPEHLVVGLLEEGEGIAAHVLGNMGVTLEQFQSARNGASVASKPWPAVGVRVLVHDPEPPYRLWEGAVTGYDEGAVLVSVPGHPNSPEARVAAGELHVLPIGRSAYDCARCRYSESGG